MTTEQKQLIEKFRHNGLSYKEIAEIISISENTIKSYCRRNNLNDIKSNKTQDIKEVHTSCKHCGKPLKQEPKGQNKKFCSEECRRAWWKANDSKLTKKAYYILTCTGCGKQFESYGNKNRKYCCHACYINSRFRKESDTNDTRAV